MSQCVLEVISCLGLQDGKDYIPLTAGVEAEGSPVTPDPRSLYSRPQSGEIQEAQLHYDNPPSLGSAWWFYSPLLCLKIKNTRRWMSFNRFSPLRRTSQQSERCSRPLSVKTFEDIPVAHSSVMVSVCDTINSHSTNRFNILATVRMSNIFFVLKCPSTFTWNISTC